MADDSRERAEEASAELKVTDRRLFTADGELRSEAREESDGDKAHVTDIMESAVRERDRPPAVGPGFERQSLDEPEGVDFTMLINAMAEPALLFLGELEHPETGRPTLDLERARLQIDLLHLLRVKCRGNLTPPEDGLLDRVLYQLRMLFVARAKQTHP